jgi:hypothetical protein
MYFVNEEQSEEQSVRTLEPETVTNNSHQQA